MFKNMKQKISKNIKKFDHIINKYKTSTVLTIIILLMIYFTYIYYHDYFDVLKDPNKVKEIVTSYGKYSVLVFLLLQVIQVVIFIIPGEIVQVAGGYIYGPFLGSIMSIIGITIGSMIDYFISNKLGKPFVEKIVKKDKLSFFERILKKCNNNNIIFTLYLIPGLPKDILGYVCGISEITFKNFIIYSTLGRLPGIFMSSYFGHKITTGDTTTLVVIASIMIVLFVVGVLNGEKLISKISKKR